MVKDDSTKRNAIQAFIKRISGQVIIFFIAVVFGCVEPYNPPAIDEVVDVGFRPPQNIEGEPLCAFMTDARQTFEFVDQPGNGF